MEQFIYSAGATGMRIVNEWFFNTPPDVFLEGTVLLIVLAFAISGLRALQRQA